MTKRVMDWDEFTSHCHWLATKISRQLPECIVGVSRGGLIPAVVIAKKLRLPLRVYDPMNPINTCFHDMKSVLIVDDLYALGRTYHRIKKEVENVDSLKWTYATILLDSNNNQNREPLPDDHHFMTSLLSKDWIVFPWENDKDVVEGDHGLFRDDTDQYARKIPPISHFGLGEIG